MMENDLNNGTIIESKIGVDATSMKFNSIVAMEMNPFVNPGALAWKSLVNGKTYDEKWNNIIRIHNDFVGRELERNRNVYESEAATNK